MGGCTSAKSNEVPAANIPGAYEREESLWEKIEKYNFDTTTYKFAIEIQETYT